MENFNCQSRGGSCIQHHRNVELPSPVVLPCKVVLLDFGSYSQVYTEPFWADKQTLNEEKRLDWINFHQLLTISLAMYVEKTLPPSSLTPP